MNYHLEITKNRVKIICIPEGRQMGDGKGAQGFKMFIAEEPLLHLSLEEAARRIESMEAYLT